jgi:cell division protein FtsL
VTGLPAIGLGAKLASATGFLPRLPRWLWILLAVVAAGAVGAIWHQHRTHATIAAAEKRGEDRAYAAVEAKALKLAEQARSLAASIRSKTDDTNRRIAGDADAIRLRGPGKAACPVAAPAATGGRIAPGGDANAPMDRLPDPERVDIIGLPFAGTVAFAEQHDLNRAEVIAWREYSAALQKAWKSGER